VDNERELEVVAPAGCFEHVQAALAAGADAIYIGLKGLSARPDSWSFDLSGAREAAALIHANQRRLYMALNAGYSEHQAESVTAFVEQIAVGDVDALIVGDWGLMRRLQKLQVPIPIHASTLLGVYNIDTLHQLAEMGIQRVVLNTNLHVDEITALTRAVSGLTFELISYGGLCANDNRRCRLPHLTLNGEYSVDCAASYTQIGQYGEPGNQPSFDLHIQDIDLTPLIGMYAELGVTAFKIEGRTRSTAYITRSTQALRRAIDQYRFTTVPLNNAPYAHTRSEVQL